MDKTEEEVFKANKRALKSAAVSAILTNDAKYIPTDGNAFVTGTFDPENGDITEIKWEGSDETEFDDWKKDKTTIIIKIEKVDLTAPTAPGA